MKATWFGCNVKPKENPRQKWYGRRMVQRYPMLTQGKWACYPLQLESDVTHSLGRNFKPRESLEWWWWYIDWFKEKNRKKQNKEYIFLVNDGFVHYLSHKGSSNLCFILCHDKSIRNNFPSSPLIRYFLDGTALTLISVELQDMGKFSCVAINDVQVMESSANLLVIGKFWIF